MWYALAGVAYVAVSLVWLPKGYVEEYLKQVVLRWAITYVTLIIYDYGAGVVKDANGFDPSGTTFETMVAQTVHASYLLFACRSDVEEIVPLLAPGAMALFAFFQLHACWMLFFTASVFHVPMEIIVGFTFSLASSWYVYSILKIPRSEKSETAKTADEEQELVDEIPQEKDLEQGETIVVSVEEI